MSLLRVQVQALRRVYHVCIIWMFLMMSIERISRFIQYDVIAKCPMFDVSWKWIDALFNEMPIEILR